MPHIQTSRLRKAKISRSALFHIHLASLCLLPATYSLAGDKDNSSFSFKADQMVFDTSGGLNTLIGNAQISNASLSIKGQWIRIETRHKAIFRMSGTGNPITFERLASANKLIRVQSKEIEYLTTKWSLVFTGNAVLTQPGWQLSGHTIEYNIRTKTIKSTGVKNKQISITYMPNS